MKRKLEFRFELLRGGAYYALLKADMGKPPTINMDDAGALKMSMSGTFAPYAVDVDGNRQEIDWLSDEIRPVLVIDGVDYPLGVYLIAKAEETKKLNTRLVNIQAFDRGLRVRDTKAENLLYWPSGTLYLDAVEQLLVVAGINTVFKVDNAAVFSEDREDWPLGVSYLDVINDLLEEINYKALWFNESGAAVLEPVVVPESASAQNAFDFTNPETLVLTESSKTSDIYERANVFLVYCANPDKTDNMISTAVNDNPQSPLSIQRRGRRIVQVEEVNNIASQSELDKYAAWQRDKSLMTGEIVKLATGLRPGFGVAQAVSITDSDGVSIGIEHAFTMSLEIGGKMSHAVERIIYNLEQ